MNQAEVETFIESLENVQQTESYGYKFYFIGDDHMLPFTTIANTDNDYDNVSNLNRPGVFRINIGVSRTTFDSLIPKTTSEPTDYTILNTFLPHPDYAKQNFICILNPTGDNIEKTKQLIQEAHAIATTRFQRKAKD
jgi:Family of unknown function (DUF6194)